MAFRIKRIFEVFHRVPFFRSSFSLSVRFFSNKIVFQSQSLHVVPRRFVLYALRINGNAPVVIYPFSRPSIQFQFGYFSNEAYADILCVQTAERTGNKSNKLSIQLTSSARRAFIEKAINSGLVYDGRNSKDFCHSITACICVAREGPAPNSGILAAPPTALADK